MLTISLKAAAYFLTGSVSLLSDALEAVVNLAGALMALTMITIAVRPADEEHTYGHSKAEYFSSGVEGTLILIAAVSIIITAIPRLFSPQPLEQIGLGIAVSIMAAAINLAVALVLMKVGKRYQSISLEANAHHLLTDVWTTVGVLIGVAVVALTGWERLDPIIALIVAANIVWSGYRLIRNSVLGLMDTALPVEEREKIQSVLAPYMQSDVEFHALRTRQSGMRKFVSMHVLAPGSWTVQRGHQLLERIEADIRAELSNVTVFTHLEPFDDPASWKDTDLDRVEISPLDGEGNTSTDT